MNNNIALEEMERLVAGHTDIKKALIAMVTRSKLRHFQKYIKGLDSEFLLSPMKILLVGSSGTGKTFLVDSLRKVMGFPLVKVDATQLTPSGAGGGIKQAGLKAMIMEEATRMCSERPYEYFSIDGAVDRTVVFIDEIDKLGNPWESSGNWNKHVQSNFLTLFDNKDEFAGVSFVFAGAFTSITTKKKLVRRGIGFHGISEHTDDSLMDDKVVEAGLIPEIVGRLTYIGELDVLDKDAYSAILKERVLPKRQIDLAAFGVLNATLTDEEIDDIAEKAMKSGQGVRYLIRAVERKFLEYEFEASTAYLTYGQPR